MMMKAEIGAMCLQFLAKKRPKFVSNYQKLGERQGTDSPSQPLGGTGLAATLILDF